MNQELIWSTGSQLAAVILLSLSLALLYFVVWGVTWLGQEIWAWIDDTPSKYDLFTQRVADLRGLTVHRSCTGYNNYFNKKSRDVGCHLPNVIGLMLTPLALWIVYTFTAVSLIILVAVGLAHTARKARRVSKMLIKHMGDKDAHVGNSK